MKLKIKILATLLTILAMQINYSQTLTEYQKNLAKKYEIELDKNYSATAIIQILEIVEEENKIAIKTAYQEGYKAAILELKPQLELYRRKYEELNSIQLTKTLKYSIISSVSGLCVGIIGTSLLQIKK